jgi:hypothetical protein
LSRQGYWEECVSTAAGDCGLELTPEQLDCLAGAAEGCHENYGVAYPSPSFSDRMSDIRGECEAKLRALRDEHEAFQRSAEKAVRRALKVRWNAPVSIEPDGGVLLHDGRTERLQ